MKKIDIAGIPFTPESIENLKGYIMPFDSINPSRIEEDIRSLNNVQSFVIKKWSELDEDSDHEVKRVLTDIEYIKDNLSSILIKEGGQL